MSYGAMGGDGQPQFQAADLHAPREFGMGPVEAVRRAALAARPHLGLRQHQPEVREPVRSRRCCARWSAPGHEVEVIGDGYSDTFGHAGMLVREPKGSIAAAHDPRSDGGSAGI